MMTLSLTIINLLAISFNPVSSGSPGASLDLFTQKTLYSGIGPNQPSEMFGPEETVILCAFVSMSGMPVNATLVAYEITGPMHDQTQLTFHQTAQSNSSGIAETSFTLQVINQTEAFGTWSVTATANVDGILCSDTLTFPVDYLVELISVTTLDETLTPRTAFGIDGYVGIEILLRDNARVEKNALIGITVFDELNVPVSSTEIDNFTVPPNGRTWYIFDKLYLPKFGVPGQATISVVAIRPDNAPYCPKVSTTFTITIPNPISPDFVDASVFLGYLSETARPGEIVPIMVTARNEGTVAVSSFTVNLYADSSLIASYVTNPLNPYDAQTFSASWDTSGLPDGTYAITASIPTFTNEADLSDNSYTSLIELQTLAPTYVHDLKVVTVTCSPHDVYQGDIVYVTVVVKNNGNTAESTGVGAYYDTVLILEQSIVGLAPDSEETLTFSWNTMNVPPGTYQISGVANPVEGETNVADNTVHDDTVTVRVRPPPVVHDVAVTALAASPNVAEPGTLITVTATVNNLGNTPEGFNTTFFYDSYQFSSLSVSFLAPGAQQTLTTVWNTYGIAEGNYTIKAYIPPLPNEVNITNNSYVDGIVQIKVVHPPPAAHDVAVTAVDPSTFQVYVGDSVTISVKAANLGDSSESFNVNVYTNMSFLDRKQVSLAVGSSTTLSFIWATQGLTEGSYTIWASADVVPGETNTSNNVFIDGTVTLIRPPEVIHDVAIVSITPYSQIVFIGDQLTVSVVTRNNGKASESFIVTLFYDGYPIEDLPVSSLPSQAEQTLMFLWDTSNVAEGDYALSALAHPVPGETNLANNRLDDGAVTVRRRPIELVPDIAVIDISVNLTEVYAGENTTIEVTVLNLGQQPVSFGVTVYYNSSRVGIATVSSLAPYVSQTAKFEWNTKNVDPGVYTISANATILPGETNVGNNSMADGEVTIKLLPPIPYDALLAATLAVVAFAAILAALALLLLLLFSRRRRRKKRPPQPRYVIVVHPHI